MEDLSSVLTSAVHKWQNSCEQQQQRLRDLKRARVEYQATASQRSSFDNVLPLLAQLSMPHAKLDIQLDGEEPGPDGLGMMTLLWLRTQVCRLGRLGAIPSGESARLTLALAALGKGRPDASDGL